MRSCQPRGGSGDARRWERGCRAARVPDREGVSYQPGGEEDGEQGQAGAHHDEEEEDDERVLLAHAVVGLVEPVPGAGLLAARPAAAAARLFCPLQQVAASPPHHHRFLPHRAEPAQLPQRRRRRCCRRQPGSGAGRAPAREAERRSRGGGGGGSGMVRRAPAAQPARGSVPLRKAPPRTHMPLPTPPEVGAGGSLLLVEEGSGRPPRTSTQGAAAGAGGASSGDLESSPCPACDRETSPLPALPKGSAASSGASPDGDSAAAAGRARWRGARRVPLPPAAAPVLPGPPRGRRSGAAPAAFPRVRGSTSRREREIGLKISLKLLLQARRAWPVCFAKYLSRSLNLLSKNHTSIFVERRNSR